MRSRPSIKTNLVQALQRDNKSPDFFDEQPYGLDKLKIESTVLCAGIPLLLVPLHSLPLPITDRWIICCKELDKRNHHEGYRD